MPLSEPTLADYEIRRQLRRDNAGRGTHERGAFVLFTDFTGSEYGKRTEDLRRAARYEPFMLQREDEELCVYWMHAAPHQEREPAPVAILHEPEDWRSHPLDCKCHECSSPMPTRYAQAWSEA